MDHQFRNATFGGFNREDVLNYLETFTKEHAQNRQALEQKLSQAEEELDQLSAQQAELDQLNRALKQEKEGLVHSLEQAQSELAVLRPRAEEQNRSLAEVRRELEQLRAQVAQLAPDAAAYNAVKERTAGVELEAHCRAQGVLDQAGEQAHQLRQQMEQWVARVAREYDALRGQVDATISHASDELGRVRLDLEGISQMLADQDAVLDELADVYARTDAAKVPAPMPISEEE